MIGAIRERAERAEREVHALAVAARDPRTPWHAKALAVGLVAYVASPVDPLPDFLPVVGFLDELIVVPVGVVVVRRLLPADVLTDARERVDESANVGRARWVVAGLALALWVLAAWWLLANVA